MSFLPIIMTTVVLYALGSVLIVSLLSLVGIFFFLVSAPLVRHSLIYVVSFSTGAILGDVFIHIFPEMTEMGELFSQGMMIVLGGMVFSFAVEKIIRWRHCHDLPDQHEHHDHHHHHHPVGVMSLIGESMHNFIDGIVIAAAFLADVRIGISTTLAVMFHEIPQEIGDFAILLHSGYSKRRALLLNFLSALTAVAGAAVVLLTSASIEPFTQYILPFAAGNLLYIAGSDLIPELHRHTRLSQGFLQLIAMIMGIGVMYLMLFLE